MSSYEKCSICGGVTRSDPITTTTKCSNDNCPSNNAETKIETMPMRSEIKELRDYCEKGINWADHLMGKLKALEGSERIKSGDMFVIDGSVCIVKFHTDLNPALSPLLRELIIKK